MNQAEWLFFASSFDHFSGPNTALLDLCVSLQRLEFRFAVVTHATQHDSRFVSRVTFPRMPLLNGNSMAQRASNFLPNMVLVRKILRKRRPTGVYVASGLDLAYQAWMSTGQGVVTGYNVLWNCPHLGWERWTGLPACSHSAPRRLTYQVLDRVLADFANRRIVAHTHYQRRLYEWVGIPRSRIVVIPHGIDLERVTAAASGSTPDQLAPYSESSNLKVMFSARHVQEKGPLTLLEACQRASRKFPVDLLMTGDGPLQGAVIRRVEQAKQSHPHLRVFLPGYLPMEEHLRCMKASDIVANLAPVETFGIVNLEAMALRKPVISTKFGGVGEILRDGREGLLVDPREEGQVDRAIDSLIDDGVRRKLGERGWTRVSQDFDIGRVAPEFARFLEGSI